jgi:3-hydroxybutyryl-CoA dehydrogenase
MQDRQAVEPVAVGVVGGGAMGVGIAYVFAAAGHPTTVVEPDSQRATAVHLILADAADDGLRRGKLDDNGRARLLDNIIVVDAVVGLPCDLALVVESVPERLELKQRVLREIDGRAPRLVATNTSALSVSQLAGEVGDPTRFLGMHFFNPVWSLALVEIIRGRQTSDDTIATALTLVASIGKEPIIVNDSPGFATSRLDLIAALEAMRMVEDGVASAADIDRAMVIAYRHPIGPLRLSDVVGLDVRLDIARNLAVDLGPRYAPPRILEELVDAGHLGKKSGRGFFEWPQSATMELS